VSSPLLFFRSSPCNFQSSYFSLCWRWFDGYRGFLFKTFRLCPSFSTPFRQILLLLSVGKAGEIVTPFACSDCFPHSQNSPLSSQRSPRKVGPLRGKPLVFLVSCISRRNYLLRCRVSLKKHVSFFARWHFFAFGPVSPQ